mgnify:FL=1
MALTTQGVFGRTLFKNEARNRGVFGRTKFYVVSNTRGIFGRTRFHTDIHLWHPEDVSGVGRLDSVNDWKDPWWFGNQARWCDDTNDFGAGTQWTPDLVLFETDTVFTGGDTPYAGDGVVFNGTEEWVQTADDCPAGDGWIVRQTLFNQGLFGRVNFTT